MQPIFFEFSELSLALGEISKRHNIDLLKVLTSPNIIERQKVNSVSELLEILNSEESLFESMETGRIVLVDILDIDLNPKLIESIAKTPTENYIFVHSSTAETFDADTKKLLKKNDLEIVTLKKVDPEVIKHLARDYSTNLGIKASAKKVEDLATQCISYFEIIDSLDFIVLADDQNSAIDSMLKPFKLQLFMRGFNPNSLSIKEIRPWVKDVDEGELQLALSLIFTKLSKLDSPLSKKLLQELILTDQRIKTRAKISPLIWYRLFLYKCIQTV
jgi:hypothetical protein